MIGQEHTEKILRSHLAKYDVHVEPNTELVSFEQNADGVNAKLLKRDGSQEKTETVSVDWLVGADGARSQCLLSLLLEYLINDSQALCASSLALRLRGRLVKRTVCSSWISS